MRNFYALFFLFFTACLTAQNIDRVEVNGRVLVPGDADVEGVAIYNISSQKGTVTDAAGAFKIDVAENDRIHVQALQFQSFIVIVDEGVIDKKQMNIYLNPAVNKLDEVIVRPYDLSGNIRVDVAEIDTNVLMPNWDTSYEALEFEYQFKPDRLSKVEGNAAEEALGYTNVRQGANVLGLIALLFDEKSDEELSNKDLQEKQKIYVALRQRFSNQYLKDNFGIDKEHAPDFLYYVEESGLNSEMLLGRNELELVQYLRNKSEQYKAEVIND